MLPLLSQFPVQWQRGPCLRRGAGLGKVIIPASPIGGSVVGVTECLHDDTIEVDRIICFSQLMKFLSVLSR